MLGIKRQSERYIRFFSTPDGRDLLKDLYLQCGKRPSFDPKSDRKTLYNEGQRSVYLRIMHLTNLDPRTLEIEAERERE